MQQEDYSGSKMDPGPSELTELRSEAESILRQLGLSSHAAKSFLAISKDPLIPASVLCRQTGIKDTKIYYALKELEEMGIVIKMEGTPNVYSSQDLKEVDAILIGLLEKEHAAKVSRVARLGEILEYCSLKTSQIPDDLEIQYVVRGLERVIDRSIKLLATAEREVTAYIWNDDLFLALRGELGILASKGVKLKIALSPRLKKLEENLNQNNLNAFARKDLTSELNILIIEGKKMITINHGAVNCWAPPQWAATITEDPRMVSVGTSYFENPDLGIAL